MLQQTFQALEKAFDDDNDACIDCAKSVVEVVCRVIIEAIDNPSAPIRPKDSSPSFGTWVSSAIRVLKLGDIRHSAFQKMVSQHHKLTESLGALRNEAGPVSHGKDAFVERLSGYHRRTAVLSADAIVAFLHAAYLESSVNLRQTKLPYEHFPTQHAHIDRFASMEVFRNEDGQHYVTVTITNDEFQIAVDPSQLLFHFDRAAYVEAMRLGQDLNASIIDDWPAIEPFPNLERAPDDPKAIS
jgi:hypothetical protein